MPEAGPWLETDDTTVENATPRSGQHYGLTASGALGDGDAGFGVPSWEIGGTLGFALSRPALTAPPGTAYLASQGATTFLLESAGWSPPYIALPEGAIGVQFEGSEPLGFDVEFAMSVRAYFEDSGVTATGIAARLFVAPDDQWNTPSEALAGEVLASGTWFDPTPPNPYIPVAVDLTPYVTLDEPLTLGVYPDFDPSVIPPPSFGGGSSYHIELQSWSIDALWHNPRHRFIYLSPGAPTGGATSQVRQRQVRR